MSSRGRIGFLTVGDAEDRRVWSGTIYYMSKALRDSHWEVIYLGPVASQLTLVGRILDNVARFLFGKRFEIKKSAIYSRHVSAIASRRVSLQPVDCIIAPAATACLAYLREFDAPVIFLSDTTFALVNGYYASASNLLEASVRSANDLEKRAMDRANIVAFPSRWAAASAIRDYGIPTKKVNVIPFGANFDVEPSAQVAVNRRRSGECRLLFIGVDWLRKGGDIVVETLLELENTYGIRANVFVVGCQPPESVEHDRLHVIGFLDKNDADQASRLERLFLDSDYLFVPTRSECYGLVYCEASAFGLPSIATDTGGVSAIVSEGENGYLLPLASRGNDYAGIIADLESDDEVYQALCRSSRKEFDDRLNWRAWANHISSLIENEI